MASERAGDDRKRLGRLALHKHSNAHRFPLHFSPFAFGRDRCQCVWGCAGGQAKVSDCAERSRAELELGEGDGVGDSREATGATDRTTLMRQAATPARLQERSSWVNTSLWPSNRIALLTRACWRDWGRASRAAINRTRLPIRQARLLQHWQLRRVRRRPCRHGRWSLAGPAPGRAHQSRMRVRRVS